MRNTTIASTAAGILICGAAAHGQNAVPIGGEVQINSTTTYLAGNSTVSALAGGGFVVTWEDFSQSIQGRVFDATGAAIGETFQVNSYTTGEQIYPSTTALGSGFVVVWQHQRSGSSIQARRFDEHGTAVGEQFQVNSQVRNTHKRPVIATIADDEFVVLWQSRLERLFPRDVLGQRFAANGTRIGEPFQVNFDTMNSFHPEATALNDGGFLALWASRSPPGSDTFHSSIQGRRYSASGIAVGEQFQVNSAIGGFRGTPAAAARDDGGFVVVWYDSPTTSLTSGGEIKARWYPAGIPSGVEFQVNAYTPEAQRSPSVAPLSGGGFAIAWHSHGSSGSDSSTRSVQRRLYAADGTAMGGDFQVNVHTTNRQGYPSVAPLNDDGFVVAWDDYYAFYRGRIRARRYAGPRYALAGLDDGCLGLEANESADGTLIELDTCQGGDNQTWRFNLTATSQRVVGPDGKCLLPGLIDESGDPRAVIGECGGPNDQWILATPGHAAPSRLIHADTGLCLDAQGEGAMDGRPARLAECQGGADQLWRPAAEVCTQDVFGACLGQERFRIDLEWRSFDGTTGAGKVVPRTSSGDSGLLWFFEADNWEMLIKVLDGCELNDRLWVFAAATTTVEYTLRVTDTATGIIREYFNALGNAAAAITDTDAFAACSAAGAADIPAPIEPASSVSPRDDESLIRSAPEKLSGACIPSETRICLADGRFSIQAEWRDYTGNQGSARAVPVGSEDSGLLWFFSDNNWEMLVKVLDACDLNGQFLFLGAATTDVEYTVTVTDTDTEVTWQHTNPLGNASEALVHWFETCP